MLYNCRPANGCVPRGHSLAPILALHGAVGNYLLRPTVYCPRLFSVDRCTVLGADCHEISYDCNADDANSILGMMNHRQRLKRFNSQFWYPQLMKAYNEL